jgi:hypothetical protein
VSELCSSHLVSELRFSDPGLWPPSYQILSDPAFSQTHRFRVSLRNLVVDHQPGPWPRKNQILLKKKKKKKNYIENIYIYIYI